MISVSVPDDGEGISASTLSVEISRRGSSRSTFSPTFFSQRTMVPSAIDSPIWGMTTSIGIAGLLLVSTQAVLLPRAELYRDSVDRTPPAAASRAWERRVRRFV